MNERIKELAEQAGAVYGNDHAVSLLDDEIEKFAELIIRECCAEISDMYTEADDGNTDSWDRGYLAGLSRASILIQEHFGVEE